MKIFKKVLITAVSIVLACAVLTACNNETKPVEGERQLTVSLVINENTATLTEKRKDKADIVYTCGISSSSSTVEDILNDLSYATDFEYGITKAGSDAYLKSMFDVLAVEKNKEYFAFYIDGEYAQYGITGTKFQEGVIYEFILSTW